jgi:NADH dehydrogenase
VQFPNSPIENAKKGYTFARVDLGGTRNLVDAARAAGAGHYVDLSGVGAAPDGRYHWLRYKWEGEQHVIASGVPYTILRPSWVYGPGDVSLNRFLGFAKFLPFVPVIGDGKTRVNPVFVGDVAAHVAAALTLPEARNEIFEIGGPAVLTMDEIVRAALKASGKKRFLLHQPKPLMKLVAGVARFAPGPPLTPDAIEFITMDGVADTAALQDAFKLRLTPLDEGLGTYLGQRG